MAQGNGQRFREFLQSSAFLQYLAVHLLGPGALIIVAIASTGLDAFQLKANDTRDPGGHSLLLDGEESRKARDLLIDSLQPIRAPRMLMQSLNQFVAQPKSLGLFLYSAFPNCPV